MRLTLLPERAELEVSPDRPVLESALRSGVGLPHSCRGGSCGACRATLVSGAIHYPHGVGMGLTLEEQAAQQILLCRAHPQTDLTVEVRTVRAANEIGPRHLPCRVSELKTLSPNVRQITLRLPAIEPFDWQPGQYVDLILADGTRRSYSIASIPHDGRDLCLHVSRVASGQMTSALFAMTAPGSILAVEGPYGCMPVPHGSGDSPLVMIAGGTGYAPLRAMLRALSLGEWQRPTRLYFGAKSAVELYADEELRALTVAHPNFSYWPVSKDGAGVPGVHAGRVHAVVLSEETDLSMTDVYAAGPDGLIESVRHELLGRGLIATRFHVDSFG